MNVVQQQLVVAFNSSPMHDINGQAGVQNKQQRVIVAEPGLLLRVGVGFVDAGQKLDHQTQQIVQTHNYQ